MQVAMLVEMQAEMLVIMQVTIDSNDVSMISPVWIPSTDGILAVPQTV